MRVFVKVEYTFPRLQDPGPGAAESGEKVRVLPAQERSSAKEEPQAGQWQE